MRAVLAVCLLLGAGIAAPAASADTCTPRLLVLSAYPGEMDKLLTDDTARFDETAEVAGRRFHVGTLRGRDVALGLTGIGLVNATTTTQAALDHFRCGASPQITGVVFSGVAGGRTFLGDVVVPARWTDDEGATWLAVDEAMLAVARQVAERPDVVLARDVPAGDPLCVGHDPRVLTSVTFDHEPEIHVGGDGKSTDPFNGRGFPCFPGGGDVFGCEPCRADPHPPDPARLAEEIAPFADPDFFFGYFRDPPPPTTDWDAEDMESAAAARVAAAHSLPFVAFRGVSDGQGDPLSLPGFPFQFFAYRQVAADNAAAVTLAFLEMWSPATAAGAVEPPGQAPARGAGRALPATGGGAGTLALVLAGLGLSLTRLGRDRRTRRARRRRTRSRRRSAASGAPAGPARPRRGRRRRG